MIKFYLDSSFRIIWQQFATDARLNNQQVIFNDFERLFYSSYNISDH